jgi:predicted secreted protein
VGGQRLHPAAVRRPHGFDVKRHALRATILSAVLFGLYYANWTYGWVGVDALDFYNPR